MSPVLPTSVLTTRIERLWPPGESAGPDAEPSALHSGNLGDVIYSLPAVRALGVARYVLNVCHDPAMWQRSLTERGARFLAPLLLAQDPIRQVDIVRVPVTLRGMQGELVSDGLPLEGTEPQHAGVTHLFDRFRWQPDLCLRPLVESHAAAVGVSVDGAAAWLQLPDLDALRAAAAGEDAPVVVSLTPRYRSRPTNSFAELLAGFPRVVKVGVEADREAFTGIPGEFVTADDALELARLIASARFFVGSPSLPFAIAEGLKVPRLVDVFTPMPNAVPLGPLGWRLSADMHRAVAQAQALWRQQWDADVLEAKRCAVEPVPAKGEPPPRGSGVGESAPAPAAVAPSSPDTAGIDQAQWDALQAEHRALKAELDAVLGSTSWRITWPLRWLVTRARDRGLIAQRRRVPDGLVPPPDMNFVGSGDYEAIGDEFFSYFVRYGGLKPYHQVLDVGCGIGRMARPLTAYLSSRGGYHGFDVVAMGIDWCRKAYGERFPNFQFTHVDLRNSHYNPRCATEARTLRFPYDNNAFDLVVLTSVFTHMLPADVAHYLREIERVLKPGGRCLCTFFVLNETAWRYVASDPEHFNFRYPLGDGAYAVDAGSPETTVGYEEASVRQLLAAAGLALLEPIHYGEWCGRSAYLTGQDLLVARKPGGRRAWWR